MPKKDTTPTTGHNSSSNLAGAELRQFIERWEKLESEKRDIAESQKEVMAEAKGRGYDTKIIRKVIAERKRDPDDVAEEEALTDLYRAALGMDVMSGDPEEEPDGDGLV